MLYLAICLYRCQVPDSIYACNLQSFRSHIYNIGIKASNRRRYLWQAKSAVNEKERGRLINDQPMGLCGVDVVA